MIDVNKIMVIKHDQPLVVNYHWLVIMCNHENSHVKETHYGHYESVAIKYV